MRVRRRRSQKKGKATLHIGSWLNLNSVLPHKSIESRLQAAVSAVLPGAETSAVLVRPCPDPKFGEYQTNALMALAKGREMNPRQLAGGVVAKLDVCEWCEEGEIA